MPIRTDTQANSFAFRRDQESSQQVETLVMIDGGLWTLVWPRRDQVLLSGETSEKPLSSSRTRVAPNGRHFFYPGQFFFLPLLKGFLLSVQWSPLRSLVTSTHPLHHMPDSTGLVANSK
jgi:hypothetical protein